MELNYNVINRKHSMFFLWIPYLFHSYGK